MEQLHVNPTISLTNENQTVFINLVAILCSESERASDMHNLDWYGSLL
jgi:hypothetical protein